MGIDVSGVVCVAFGFVLGRTYTLTLLWNLNSRQKLREDSSNGTITFNRRRQSMITHGEVIDMKPTVSVVRTVQVDHDGDYDNTDMNSGSYVSRALECFDPALTKCTASTDTSGPEIILPSVFRCLTSTPFSLDIPRM
jgi:hypothetical protein